MAQGKGNAYKENKKNSYTPANIKYRPRPDVYVGYIEECQIIKEMEQHHKEYSDPPQCIYFPKPVVNAEHYTLPRKCSFFLFFSLCLENRGQVQGIGTVFLDGHNYFLTL